MSFPYQCLVARSQISSGSSFWTLIGASGPKLVVQSSNGTTCTWPQEEAQSTLQSSGKLISQDAQDDEQGPPGKRIKLSPPKEQKSNFSCLVLSNDAQYLVAVTGEDKCVRVFQIDSRSRLQQLSERCMSRRPSSITLTSDDSTILCADKFGDVYALPLLPSPEDEQPEVPVVEEPVENISQEKEKAFVPSATVFTVHSGRNRRTLEEQLRRKAQGPSKTKEAMTFRHDLLLGHVSMLTDLAYAESEGRGYIITADRDEHIRVSRGPPQAHIIEGFCFGHAEFISKLCITKSGFLLSGGGDTEIYVWDWKSYRLIEKIPIRDTALGYLKSQPELSPLCEDATSFKTAVSGLWAVDNGGDGANEVLVACEGLPALFSFTFGGAANANAIPLQGNALDIAVIQTSQTSWSAIVSVDNVHKPGSTTEVRDNKDASRLQYFSRSAREQWHEDAKLQSTFGAFAERGSKMVSQGAEDGTPASTNDKALRDILYSVENLRKRPGTED